MLHQEELRHDFRKNVGDQIELDQGNAFSLVNYAHCDIKPNNLMLDSTGFVQIKKILIYYFS